MKTKSLVHLVLAFFVICFGSGCSALLFWTDSSIQSRLRLSLSELSLTTTQSVLILGNTTLLQATGGSSPYFFEIVSGPGSVDASTGVYTASGTAGSALVQVRDLTGTVRSLSLVVHSALSATSSSITQRGAPGSVSYLDGVEISGGALPYTFSILSGDGQIDPATGVYTTPNSQAITRVGVTDSIGNSIEVQIQDSPLFVNGTISTSSVSGSTSYIGGRFTRIKPSYTPGIVILNEIGGAISPSDCNYKRKINSGAYVYSAVRDGGSLFVGGNAMTSFGGTSIGNLIKINLSDCTVDTTFTQSTTVNSSVTDLVIVGNNLYVAGGFTTYRGLALPYLLKLSTVSGDADTTFNNGTSFNSQPIRLTYSAGFIYAGGLFATYRAGPAQGIAKIDAVSGALDTAFTQATGLSGQVARLIVEGSSLFICGQLSLYRGGGVTDIIKLDSTNGNLDPGFTITLGFPGKCYDASSDGTSLYIAGEYSQISDGTITQNSPNVGKVNLATGAIDTTFSQTSGLIAQSVGASSILYLNGNVYVSSYASFDLYRGQPVASFFRVDSINGNLDTTFSNNVSLDENTERIFDFGSGQIGLVGNFTNSGGLLALGLAKMDIINNEIDTAFSASGGFNSFVQSLVLVGGSLYVGGGFTTYRGGTANYIAKVDSNSGNLDTSFTQVTGFNNSVVSLLYTNSAIYAAGHFSSYRATTANYLAKIDPATGSLDTTFTQATGIAHSSFTPYGRTLTTDGSSSIYVSGYFNRYRGAAVGHLAKVDWTNGNLDGTFTQVAGLSGPGGYAVGYDLQYFSGFIFVGGYFTSYRGATAINIAKIDATSGVLDTAFTQATSYASTVSKLFINGTAIYVMGGGATYRGASVYGLSKLDLILGNLDLAFQSNSGFSIAPSHIQALGIDTLVTYGGCTYRGVGLCQIIKIEKDTGVLK